MVRKLFPPHLHRLLILIIMVIGFAGMGSLSLTHTQAASTIKVQIDKGGGTDNTQETTFNFLVKNTGSAAVSGISVRIYFSPDGSNAASSYVMEKYYDQSGAATISSPTLLSGSTYYFTVSYGTASLAAGGQWEFQTALHLSSWASTFSGANDYYHTGYAVGALPAAYTDTNYITAYVSGTLAWGTEPGGATPTVTNTFLPPPTTVVPDTTPTATTTADLTIQGTVQATTYGCGTGLATPYPQSNVGIVVSYNNAGGQVVATTDSTGHYLVDLGNVAIGTSVTVSAQVPWPNPMSYNWVHNQAENKTLNFNSGSDITNTPCPTFTMTPGSATPVASATNLTPSSTPAFANGDTFVEGLVTITTACGGFAPQSGAVITYQNKQVAVTNGSGKYFADLGVLNVTAGIATSIQLTASANGSIGTASMFVISGGNHGFVNITLAAPTPSPTPTPRSCTATNTFVPPTATASITPSSSDIAIEGHTTRPGTCGQLAPQPGVTIYASYNGNPSVYEAVSDQNGYYSFNLGNAGGQQVTVLISTNVQTMSNAAALSPQYYLWVHTAGVSEHKILDFTMTTGEGTLTPTCIPTGTATQTATVSPTPSLTPTSTISATANSWQPDLTISAMQGSVNWCIGRVVIYTTVKNQGTNSAGAFVVQIGNQAANSMEADSIPNGLAAGQSATITSYFVIPTGTTATYSAIADANNTVVESNENNNTQSINVGLSGDCPTFTPTTTKFTPSPTPTSTSIPALPDLTIASLAQNIDPCKETPVIVHATVANVGNATAGAFVLQLSQTGTTLQQTVSGLAAGKSLMLDFYFPTFGTVTAFADSTFVINEFDETNNTAMLNTNFIGAPCVGTPTYTPGGPTVTATLTFTATNTPLPSATPSGTVTVVSALPDLTVTSITNAPATVPCGSGWNPGTNVTVANSGNANAGSFTVALSNSGGGVLGQTVSGLAAGQSITVRFNQNGGALTATADSTNVIAESNESNNTASATLPVSDPIPCTATPTPVPTNATPVTPTKTNTPAVSSTPSSDPCASATVITGGGSFNISTATTCFKYVNTSFVNGGMFSIMKDSTSTSDTVKWYGGMDQNATSCANQSSTISGNGGQLNNFTVAKDANGQMFLIITGTGSNSVTISIQNWQNGAGCSVKPTVHP